MNLQIGFTNYTKNYVGGLTSTNQTYLKKYPMVETIYECDIKDFRLNTPIDVEIEQDYNDYAVYDSYTGIYSFGDTIDEAKINFCYALEDVYKHLLDDEKNLNSISKNTLDYLKSILSPRK